MITLTGNTFAHRDLIKSMGGRWNNIERVWQFAYLDSDGIGILTKLMGVFVIGASEPATPYRSWQHEPPVPPREPTQHFGDDRTYFNYFEDQDPSAFFGFTSLRAFADYVAAIDRPEPDDILRDDSAWRESELRTAFTGTADMAHALDLARNGWMDGMGVTSKLEVDGAQSKRRFNSMAGGTVNVGRMLSGDPRHMVNRKRQPGLRNIRLFVAGGMWRGIGQSIAIFRALIIGAMVDLLEQQQYRCEIIAVNCAGHMGFNNGAHSQFAIRLKDAGENLNLLDITFALGHPSFSRRLMFACADVIPECNSFGKNNTVRAAFSDNHPCGENEFYIPAIGPFEASCLDDDPMSILQFIVPDNLPIKIKGIE
jgi:hypothetical protein